MHKINQTAEVVGISMCTRPVWTLRTHQFKCRLGLIPDPDPSDEMPAWHDHCLVASIFNIGHVGIESLQCTRLPDYLCLCMSILLDTVNAFISIGLAADGPPY